MGVPVNHVIKGVIKGVRNQMRRRNRALGASSSWRGDFAELKRDLGRQAGKSVYQDARRRSGTRDEGLNPDFIVGGRGRQVAEEYLSQRMA
jgi:hypothetical protein